MTTVPWEQAWQEALYGPGGFYRRSAPIRHFVTATHPPLGVVLAEAIWRIADLLEVSSIVDVGAGRGELLAALHRHRPGRRLLGCDIVARPADLPASVHWVRGPGGPDLPDELADLDDVLVLAHEWLDVVPCPIAEVDSDGVLRLVEVEPRSGAERLASPVEGADLDWCAAHWPPGPPGSRVEIGLARDRAWAALLDRVCRGAAVAVDYGHVRGERPAEGTLAAYRDGMRVTAVPDGTCDLTAHVALNSLRHDEILTQAEVFERVGLHATPPDPAFARSEPTAYLRLLERSGAAARLTDPAGFGAFRWVLVRDAAAGRHERGLAQAGATTSRS